MWAFWTGKAMFGAFVSPICLAVMVAAPTPDAALADAVSAAREWAEHWRSTGANLPSPRSLAAISADERIDALAGEIAVLVPVLLDAGRTVRANVTFDAGLLTNIDTAAAQRGLTRSAFLTSAAREKISARR